MTLVKARASVRATIGRAVAIVGAALLAQSAFADWKYLHGNGNPVCDAVRARLNKVTVADLDQFKNHSCNSTGTLTYPGFKEPPWQDLKPNEHAKLIANLLRFADLGAEVYFGHNQVSWKAHMSQEQQLDFDRRIQQASQDFVARGGRVLLWRTRLVNDFGDPDKLLAPVGPQTVVQLRWPAEVRKDNVLACPTMAKVGDFQSLLFIVKDDLTGPDPRVRHTSSVLLGSVPMLLDGVPYFVAGAGGNVVTIGRDLGAGPTDLCELHYLRYFDDGAIAKTVGHLLDERKEFAPIRLCGRVGVAQRFARQAAVVEFDALLEPNTRRRNEHDLRRIGGLS